MLVYAQLSVVNMNGQTGTSVIKTHTNNDAFTDALWIIQT